MDVRDWTVALIEANKFEAQIIQDLLRNAGVTKFRRFADSAEALTALELYPANIILMEFDSPPLNGAEWTKAFRRNRKAVCRRAPIFILSRAVSRSMAETCRHAGVNAIIGKPISGATLLTTIKKVLAAPREFIDAEGYVGPCRRAGIVTAGIQRRRRRADASKGALAADALPVATAAFNVAAQALLAGRSAADAEARLNEIQTLAKTAGDAPLMRACATASLLIAEPAPMSPAFKVALQACADGLDRLAELPIADAAPREGLAESLREAVAKAAAKQAA